MVLGSRVKHQHSLVRNDPLWPKLWPSCATTGALDFPSITQAALYRYTGTYIWLVCSVLVKGQLPTTNEKKSAWSDRAAVNKDSACMRHSRSTPNLFLHSKYCLFLLVSKDWPVNGDASSSWVPDYREESFFLWIFPADFQHFSKDLSFPETDFQLSLEGAVAPASSNLPLLSWWDLPRAAVLRKFPWILS